MATGMYDPTINDEGDTTYRLTPDDMDVCRKEKEAKKKEKKLNFYLAHGIMAKDTCGSPACRKYLCHNFPLQRRNNYGTSRIRKRMRQREKQKGGGGRKCFVLMNILFIFIYTGCFIPQGRHSTR